MMSAVAFAILFVSTCVSSATIPDSNVLRQPSEKNSLLISNDINEIPVGIEPEICSSTACENASASMRRYMNADIDPCDNFYQFACGKFTAENHSLFSIVSNKVLRLLEDVLTEKPTPSDPRVFKLANDFYKSCENAKNYAASDTEVYELVNKTLNKYGGWPAVKGNDWNSDGWNWMEHETNISNDSLDGLVEPGIDVDSKNNSRRVLTIDHPTFIVNDLYYKSLPHQCRGKMFKVAAALGINRTEAEKELNKTLEFEEELTMMSMTPEQQRNVTAIYNPITIRELQTKYPYMNWLGYFTSFLRNQINITQEEIVIVRDPNYFAKLNDTLQSTPKQMIANYFAWKFIFQIANFQKFTCVMHTKLGLPIAVNAMYLRKYSNETQKEAATNLANKIHEELVKMMENVSWLDNKTKAAAIEKAKEIANGRIVVGYPYELMDTEKVEDYYSGLKLDSKSFLQNFLRISNFMSNKTIHEFRKPRSKIDLVLHSKMAIIGLLANAFYAPSENSIDVLIGLLQDPFFSVDRPSYLNYGRIGWVIGHEFMHGFGGQGRLFDKNGNLADWWETDSANNFISRANGFINQYSNYTKQLPDGTHFTVNGNLTLGENIADNEGIKLAYAAYQTFVKQNGPEQILPEFQNYTSDQLFWISAAQLWCSEETFDPTDPHAPDEFRVIGAFSNIDSFSRDFGCPPGSKMNPKNKYEVW